MTLHLTYEHAYKHSLIAKQPKEKKKLPKIPMFLFHFISIFIFYYMHHVLCRKVKGQK